MPIEFRCSTCNKLLRAPDGSGGKRVRCPHCSAESTIPAPGGEAAGAPPAGGWAPNEPISAGSPNAEFAAAPGRLRRSNLDAGDVLSVSWQIYKAKFAQVAVGVLLVALLGAVIQGVFQLLVGIAASIDRDLIYPASTLSIVANLGVGAYLYSGLFLYLLRIARAQDAPLQLIFFGGPYALRAFGINILFAIAVGIGSMMCIVPGIYLTLLFSMALPALVDRNLGVIESFNASIELTKGNKLQMFVIWLAATGLMIAGLLVCGVGVLAVIPYVSLAFVVSYLRMSGQPIAVPAPAYTTG